MNYIRMGLKAIKRLLSLLLLFVCLNEGTSLLNEPSWAAMAVGIVLLVVGVVQFQWAWKNVYKRISEWIEKGRIK